MTETTRLFTTLHVEVLTTGRNFRLTKEFTYSPPGDKPIIVPVDSKTDFASIPRLLTILIPKLGKHTYPAVVHDYLCRTAPNWKARATGDQVFRQAMEAIGVGCLKRWAMWLAVRLAGWFFWTFNINGRVGKQADEERKEARKERVAMLRAWAKERGVDKPPSQRKETPNNALKHDAEDLGWVSTKGGQGIIRSLDAKLDNAKRAIERSNILTAKNILGAFLNEVEAQGCSTYKDCNKGKHLKPEAYSLLKYNVEYLLGKL